MISNKIFQIMCIIFILNVISVNAIPAIDAQNLTNLPPLTKLVDGWHFRNGNLLSYNNKINESVTGTITSATDKWGNTTQALSTKSNSCGRWNITSIALDNFTVCAWIKDLDVGQFTISTASKHATSGIDTLSLFYNYDTFIFNGISYASGSGYSGFPNNYVSFTFSNWNFVCTTYNKNGGANGAYMYVNNVAQPVPHQTDNIKFNITHFVMGCRYTNGASYFTSPGNSYFDEVTIWNDILNSTQLSALYYTYDNWDYTPSPIYNTVNLLNPVTNSNLTLGLYNFTYYVNATNLGRCELYFNGTYNIANITTPTNLQNNTFINVNISNYNVWNVKCYSSDTNNNNFATNNFTYNIIYPQYPITINSNTYNVTSAYSNQTIWRTNQSSYVYTYDSTPTVTFTVSDISNCSISKYNLNYTDMINNDSNTKCQTINTTSHTCTLPTTKELSYSSNNVYISCVGNNNYELGNSTSGSLAIWLYYTANYSLIERTDYSYDITALNSYYNVTNQSIIPVSIVNLDNSYTPTLYVMFNASSEYVDKIISINSKLKFNATNKYYINTTYNATYICSDIKPIQISEDNLTYYVERISYKFNNTNKYQYYNGSTYLPVNVTTNCLGNQSFYLDTVTYNFTKYDAFSLEYYSSYDVQPDNTSRIDNIYLYLDDVLCDVDTLNKNVWTTLSCNNKPMKNLTIKIGKTTIDTNSGLLYIRNMKGIDTGFDNLNQFQSFYNTVNNFTTRTNLTTNSYVAVGTLPYNTTTNLYYWLRVLYPYKGISYNYVYKVE